MAVGPHGQLTAGVHRHAVQVDRAGPTLSPVAADLRADEIEVIAQQLDERPSILDLHGVGVAVDGEDNGGSRCRHGATFLRCGRSASARAVDRGRDG